MHVNQQQPQPLDGLPLSGFLRLPQVLELIPVSRASWWAGIAKGSYPRPVKLAANTTAWRISDIRSLIAKINAQQPTEFSTNASA